MVTAAAKRLSTTAEMQGSVDVAMHGDITASLVRMEKEIWDVGRGVYTAAELAVLRERVGKWWEDKADKSSAGVV